jgi:hypothetical protein
MHGFGHQVWTAPEASGATAATSRICSPSTAPSMEKSSTALLSRPLGSIWQTRLSGSLPRTGAFARDCGPSFPIPWNRPDGGCLAAPLQTDGPYIHVQGNTAWASCQSKFCDCARPWYFRGMSNLFRYFNCSPELICLVVMMYVRYPSLRPDPSGGDRDGRGIPILRF